MKIRLYLAMTALAVAVLSSAGAWAADNVSGQSGKLTEREMIFQSSKLSDLDVFNRDDAQKKLGNLDNLIIDARNGQVQFGILDTGVGGKKIPVPWNALRLNMSTQDNRYWLTLNKTQEELANAPTFDKSQMPDFSSPEWRRSVETFFGVRLAAKPESPQSPGELSANEMMFQSTTLSDLNVHNRNDTSKKLGNVDDLIINAHAGQVLYGILDTGIMGKSIAVPWNAFQLQKATDKDQYWLTLNKTQEELANAPTFDTNRMSDVTDSRWQQTVDRFFGTRTAAHPEQQR